MTVKISGKHIEVGESLKARMEKGVEGVARRYFGEIIHAQVTVEKDTLHFYCDIALHVSRNFVVRTRGSDADAYKAFDSACKKLEKRAGRYRSRLRDRKRGGDDMVLPAAKYVVNTEADDEGHDTPLIIAEMASELATLSVGEAVMRMDLSDYPVLMFQNAKHGKLNVVYRRPDGNIGWIDPTLKA